MGYRTPNIDRIAKEGCLFTDWYGQQNCTAGRAAFITGQSPIRTGLTKVGLPGSDLGLRPEDPIIADLLKPLGYVTRQFGDALCLGISSCLRVLVVFVFALAVAKRKPGNNARLKVKQLTAVGDARARTAAARSQGGGGRLRLFNHDGLVALYNNWNRYPWNRRPERPGDV
jgi:hypothetical protein